MSMMAGKNIRRVFFSIILLAFGSLLVYGTHNRAGEITYEQLDDLTYRITVITYTATGPGPVADRPALTLQFGDGMSAEVPRIEEIFLPDYYKRNKYRFPRWCKVIPYHYNNYRQKPDKKIKYGLTYS